MRLRWKFDGGRAMIGAALGVGTWWLGIGIYLYISGDLEGRFDSLLDHIWMWSAWMLVATSFYYAQTKGRADKATAALEYERGRWETLEMLSSEFLNAAVFVERTQMEPEEALAQETIPELIVDQEVEIDE